MAINTSLLVAAPVLQDFLVGKDGQPLVNGKVICYQDNNRLTLKNWYYQSGGPGPNPENTYTYIALPNPLILSAAGTICDVNGNDVIPFFYPWVQVGTAYNVERYFIQVYDKNGELQFTRANFPPPAAKAPALLSINTLENYIINNSFWRNIGSVAAGTIPLPAPYNSGIGYIQNGDFGQAYNTTSPQKNYYYITLAPSQHDGFSMPDLNYIKDAQGGTETITFESFPASSGTSAINDDVTPEFYINHLCSIQDPSVTLKVYQFPIMLHIANLVGQPFSVTFQAQSSAGNAVIKVSLYQFLGTGVLSGAPDLLGSEITLNTEWTKFTINSDTIFPGNNDVVTSPAGDDAFYLQIGMPTNAGGTFDINFTLPSLYLSSDEQPTNQFQTYDQIDAVINSARTGDIRTSLNKFYPYGWLPMSNGTIGAKFTRAVVPTARENVDAWPLYNLIWNSFQNFSTGTLLAGINLISQMYNPAGTAVAYGTAAGSTAISDWIAGNVLTLTQSMSKVLLGTVPVSALIAQYTATFTATPLTSIVTAADDGSGNLLLTHGSSLRLVFGQAVRFTTGGIGTLPGGLAINTTYYVTPRTTTTFWVAPSLQAAQNDNVIRFTSSGTATTTATSFSLVLTAANAVDCFIGAPIMFTTSTSPVGVLPTGIAANTIYYTAPSSTTTLCIATSFSNAILGNYIVYTDAGTPTNTLYISMAGATEGEYEHRQLTTEIASHVHGPLPPAVYFQGQGTNGVFNTTTNTTNPLLSPEFLTTAPTGSNTPFNITQPSTYNNVYIKL